MTICLCAICASNSSACAGNARSALRTDTEPCGRWKRSRRT
jgi:hypothetical protein